MSREIKKILRIWLTHFVLEKSQKLIEEEAILEKKKAQNKSNSWEDEGVSFQKPIGCNSSILFCRSQNKILSASLWESTRGTEEEEKEVFCL